MPKKGKKGKKSKTGKSDTKRRTRRGEEATIKTDLLGEDVTKSILGEDSPPELDSIVDVVEKDTDFFELLKPVRVAYAKSKLRPIGLPDHSDIPSLLEKKDKTETKPGSGPGLLDAAEELIKDTQTNAQRAKNEDNDNSGSPISMKEKDGSNMKSGKEEIPGETVVAEDDVEPRLTQKGTRYKPPQLSTRLSVDGDILTLYQHAQRQGYVGSINEFLMDMARQGADALGMSVSVEEDLVGGKRRLVGRGSGLGGRASGGNGGDFVDNMFEQMFGGGSEKQMKMQWIQNELRRRELDVESKQLELEKKRAEIDRIRGTNSRGNGYMVPMPKHDKDGNVVSFETVEISPEAMMMRAMSQQNSGGGRSDKQMDMMLKFQAQMMEAENKRSAMQIEMMKKDMEHQVKTLYDAIRGSDPSAQFGGFLEQLKMVKESLGSLGGTQPFQGEDLKTWLDYQEKVQHLENQRQKLNAERARVGELTQVIEKVGGKFADNIGQPLGFAISQGVAERAKAMGTIPPDKMPPAPGQAVPSPVPVKPTEPSGHVETVKYSPTKPSGDARPDTSTPGIIEEDGVTLDIGD